MCTRFTLLKHHLYNVEAKYHWSTVLCIKRSALLITVVSCVRSHNAPDGREIRHYSSEMEGQCVSDTPDTGYTRVGRLPNTAVHCSRTSEASSGQWFNYWPSHYSLCQQTGAGECSHVWVPNTFLTIDGWQCVNDTTILGKGPRHNKADGWNWVVLSFIVCLDMLSLSTYLKPCCVLSFN